jgi:hypothetical protein
VSRKRDHGSEVFASMVSNLNIGLIHKRRSMKIFFIISVALGLTNFAMAAPAYLVGGGDYTSADPTKPALNISFLHGTFVDKVLYLNEAYVPTNKDQDANFADQRIFSRISPTDFVFSNNGCEDRIHVISGDGTIAGGGAFSLVKTCSNSGYGVVYTNTYSFINDWN